MSSTDLSPVARPSIHACPQAWPTPRRPHAHPSSLPRRDQILVHHTILQPRFGGRLFLALSTAWPAPGAFVLQHEIMLQLPRPGVHRECNWLR